MTADPLHREIDELLPWYANGTLDADEHARVERHLAECDACRRELTLLREIGDTASTIVRAAPPVPDALGQTFARIEEWERSRQPSLAARLRGLAGSLFDVPRLPRLVLAGQSALILVLGAALVLSRPDESAFTALSGDAGAPGTRLTVIFEPDATEESMRQALRAVDGALVSGPTANGTYVVSLRAADPGAPAVDAAIAALRRNSSVIRFVELEP